MTSVAPAQHRRAGQAGDGHAAGGARLAPKRTPTTVLFSTAQFSAFFSRVPRPSAAAGCAGVHKRRARALPPARRHGCVLAPPWMVRGGLGARAIIGGRVHDPNWRTLFHGCTVG